MTFHEACSYSDKLKSDGNSVFKGKGLEDILSEYGKLSVVGSFDLDLLVKPDLDIYVEVPECNIKRHFSVLGEIAEKIRPLRVKYLDLRQANWPEFPMKEGLFIGINIEINGLEWSIDGWALTPEIYKERVAYHENIKQLITPGMREILFAIKYDIYANKNYRSAYLYESVLQSGVRTTEEFIGWYKGKFGKEF